jgi:glycosyltransferase involved in cell wall biosynthesis
VHYCAGDLGTVEGTLVKEMFHHNRSAQRLYRNTFIQLSDYESASAYADDLLSQAATLAGKLRRFVEEKGIDLLIPQNTWSVAAHPAVAIALTSVMRDLQLPTIAHHHDFYWERRDGVALTCKAAIDLADKHLPPRDPLIKHVVINSLSQQELTERKGIESVVVPNVFDFDSPPWEKDQYNEDFRSRLGLKDNDVVILQATRIVARKGIELAVDFVAALNTPKRRRVLQSSGLWDGRPFDDDSRIVLVLAGYARDDVTGAYVSGLAQKIDREGVDALFVEELVGARRRIQHGDKIYSLWDTYAHADFVTYPSLWEGWGNQFLEAMRAELPILLYEYPVYLADIGDKGFRVVSLGSHTTGVDDLGLVQVKPSLIEAAADQAVELLTDAALRQSTVAHNTDLCRQHYSMQALERYLKPLIA